jgi:hypothetical protein
MPPPTNRSRKGIKQPTPAIVMILASICLADRFTAAGALC